jgi:hypothetical protein
MVQVAYAYDYQITQILGLEYSWQPDALQKHLYEFSRCFPKSAFASSPSMQAHGYCDVICKIIQDGTPANKRVVTQIAEQIYAQGFRNKVFLHPDVCQKGPCFDKVKVIFQTLNKLQCQNIPIPSKEVAYHRFIEKGSLDAFRHSTIIARLLAPPVNALDLERAFEIYIQAGEKFIWTLAEKAKRFRFQAYILLREFKCPNLFHPALQDSYARYLKNEGDPSTRAADTEHLISGLMAKPFSREFDQKLGLELYHKAEEQRLWSQNNETRELRRKAYQALNSPRFIHPDILDPTEELIENENQLSLGQGIFVMNPVKRAEDRCALIEKIIEVSIGADSMLQETYRGQADLIYLDGLGEKNVWLFNGETQRVGAKAFDSLTKSNEDP